MERSGCAAQPAQRVFNTGCGFEVVAEVGMLGGAAIFFLANKPRGRHTTAKPRHDTNKIIQFPMLNSEDGIVAR